MSAAPKLYLPDVRCPRCGCPPRLRITARQIEKWKHEPPAELVLTHQCMFERRPGQRCDTIYGITAGAIQRAEEIA